MIKKIYGDSKNNNKLCNVNGGKPVYKIFTCPGTGGINTRYDRLQKFSEVDTKKKAKEVIEGLKFFGTGGKYGVVRCDDDGTRTLVFESFPASFGNEYCDRDYSDYDDNDEEKCCFCSIF